MKNEQMVDEIQPIGIIIVHENFLKDIGSICIRSVGLDQISSGLDYLAHQQLTIPTNVRGREGLRADLTNGKGPVGSTFCNSLEIVQMKH